MFLLPSSGSERVRHSLATDFRVGKASQTERVRRPAVAIELCSSISRLGNSSKLDCARLDEMVGNLRLRVTGESRKRLLGSNRIEREAAPANVRGGTKRLSTIRYSGSEFRGRFFVSEYPALVERERKRICQHVCRESAVEIRTLTGALRFFRAWTRWKITYPQKCLLIYLTDVACEDAVRRRRICTNFDE